MTRTQMTISGAEFQAIIDEQPARIREQSLRAGAMILGCCREALEREVDQINAERDALYAGTLTGKAFSDRLTDIQRRKRAALDALTALLNSLARTDKER